MIKTVMFDFGGVIFDLDYEGAVRRFSEMGLSDAAQRLDRYHQRGIFEDLECGRLTPMQFVEALQPLCDRPIDRAAVAHAWLGYVGAPVSELKLAYIDALRQRGVQVVLMSNTNPFVQEWAESPAFSASGRTLASYMDRQVLSYEIGIMKPATDFFHYALRRYDLKAGECIFLDDSQANIDVAASMGLHTMLVSKNADWREALTARLSQTD